MNDKFLKPYNPQETESQIYKLWEDSGFFNPDICIEKGVTAPDAKPFSIVMPPPNVTGVLHMGHALMLTLEDIMIRYKRMCGFKTLWLPGTDHAAIATQSKVEKEVLKKEGKNRHDLGRQEMLARVSAFAKESHDTIASQIRIMGASCDWSREAFTLDEKRNTAVKAMFRKMHDDGLIYRGHRIVNWDPKGQTTISDDEIVYESRKAKLYTFKYSKDFPISISTTRPETKVGDVAVAVHPEDERYKKFIGSTYEIEDFCGVKLSIKIIADDSVEKDFGTGALGVTPSHSMADWEMAEKNNLPKIQVINEYAKMTVGDERILGKKTTDAREVIVEWLRTEGLLEDEKEIDQNVSTAERTGGIIEPLPKLQWFISVNKEFTLPHSKIPGIESGSKTTLKEIMRHSVADGAISILPDYFSKTYFHWIENLRDWCISRQIWYGHRIPVWYDEQGTVSLPRLRKIVFVRHGESQANVHKTYAGQLDSPLTDLGRSEALATCELLKDRKIGKIISSDLSRAHDTAKIISEHFGNIPIETTKELREVYGGDLEGKATEGPILLAALRHGTGETAEELIARAKRAWELIYADDSETDIVVTGHQSFFSVMKAILHGETDIESFRHRWKMKNAGIHEFTVAIDPQGKNLTQDEDTLDTWFSAGLWTFSTLGWPEHTSDLQIYHPTDVLETGYEILFFWVARMILMSGYVLGEVPFKTVYLHGTVRDAKGQKMSKSLGNGIDPLDVAKEFGADAGRMALVYGTAPGTDSKISNDKIKGYKHFANKLWNITRFVLENTKDIELKSDFANFSEADKKLIESRDALIEEITKEMDTYMFHIASEKIYGYIWHEFADKIIEESKKIFESGTTEEILSRKYFILNTLYSLLKVLHPFMPFVTEEIWQTMFPDKMLMVSKWPLLTRNN